MDRFLADLASIFDFSFEKPWFFTEYSFLLALAFFLVGYAFLYKKGPAKLIYLIVFSLFFYYKSSGPFLLLFAGVIACDFFLARWIAGLQGNKRKTLFAFSVIYSVSFLLYFKYTNFIIDNLNRFLLTDFTHQDLFLPIGISFYTFQSLSYLIDVHRKEIEPSRSILDYAFYMTFFPHLVAGPIVRAKDFLPQIANPLAINNGTVKEAMFKITSGLVKKLLVADYLAKYVDMVHGFPTGFTGLEHSVSMYAYAFQIYFDFSGYSDIAIGIALLLGYRLKENFKNPYIAESITSFWRRWHISLSLWLRDYIYIPMGGNRKGVFRMYVFLFLTMLIGGFWHGADWKFVLWGCAHGALLILHKLFSGIFTSKTGIYRLFGVIITFHLVAFLWIFFRAQSIETAMQSIQLILSSTDMLALEGFYFARPEIIVLLAISMFIVFFPEHLKQKIMDGALSLPLFVWPFILLVALQLILQFRDDTVQPFIYFQF